MLKNKLIRFIIAVVIAFVAVYAAKHINNINGDDSTENKYDNQTESQLLDVITPHQLNSQILQYPGFIVSFNQSTHQPNWVAWKIDRAKAKTNVVGGRDNNFTEDSSVAGCATLDDYRGSGYDRGHMAPAADMKWSRNAYNATYTLTNMSPQAKSLNGGAWRHLEESCREWAIRDSCIYIICGPIFDDTPHQFIGKSQVAVPDRYFKVILAPYVNPPRAIGFIMPNSKVYGGVQTTATSVDDVEQITGFDFFWALPDDIENSIESKNNFLRWKRR